MSKRSIQFSLATAVGVALTGMVQSARATTPVVDGTLDTAIYGSALSTQTVNTGFGDSTNNNGQSPGGSELDAAYGTVQGSYLYLFFAGNIEESNSTPNHINVFIADGRSGGQNTLAASANPLNNANGLVFPSGFNATYAIDGNDYANTFYVDQFNLNANSGGYVGAVPLTNGIGNNTVNGGIIVGVNNTNVGGVNGSTGTAADPTAADAVTTGFEFAIPLSSLGNPTGSIQVLAAINGGSDTYYSNQFLPGLPVGYGNLGTPSGVNLQTNGANIVPFSVVIPTAPNGNWLPVGGGSWSTAANWSNSVVPNAVGAVASFVTATSASTVTLDGSYTVGSITFNSTFPYTITPGTGGTLTLNNGSSSATIVDSGGTQTITAPLVLASNTSINVPNHGDSVIISGNISGSGSLTAFDQGAGGATFNSSAIVLSGSNSYTGGTVVDGGVLQLGSANALPSGKALTLDARDFPSGVLDLNGFSANVGSLAVTTGPNTANLGAVGRIMNNATTAGTATFTYAGNASSPDTFPGIISDSFSTGGGTTALVVASGSLTLTNSNTYAGATTVSAGTLTLAAAGALPAGTNLNVASGATVVASNLGTGNANAVSVGTLSDTGKIDLTDNALIVHSGTLSAVSTLVGSGFSGGHWNGSTGITSSTAAADSTYLTALGVIVNDDGTGTSTPLYGAGGTINATFNGATPVDGDILVKYTYYGDANLDGAVDGSDYTKIDNGFANHLMGWQNGDFNYDHKIDGSDYTLIDNAFNTQGTSLGSNPLALIASSTAQIGGSAVPEPTTLGLLSIGGLATLRRRRRTM